MLPFVYMTALVSVSTAVVFVAEVATRILVRAMLPTSVQDSVRLGNVLVEDATVTIACETLILYAAGALGVNRVMAVPLL